MGQGRTVAEVLRDVGFQNIEGLEVRLNNEIISLNTSVQEMYRLTVKDKAMLSSDVKGGIDLNPAQMALETKKEGQDFHFNFNGHDIDAAQIVGAEFEIERLSPVTNLPFILGLTTKNNDALVKI